MVRWQDLSMYGGSYGGFTQWASMKEKVHPRIENYYYISFGCSGVDLLWKTMSS
ncbi:MAG: hypothetical protein R2942_12515 [Ignavibacteria bacterium]